MRSVQTPPSAAPSSAAVSGRKPFGEGTERSNRARSPCWRPEGCPAGVSRVMELAMSKGDEVVGLPRVVADLVRNRDRRGCPDQLVEHPMRQGGGRRRRIVAPDGHPNVALTEPRELMPNVGEPDVVGARRDRHLEPRAV